jgi:hypothetical protein
MPQPLPTQSFQIQDVIKKDTLVIVYYLYRSTVIRGMPWPTIEQLQTVEVKKYLWKAKQCDKYYSQTEHFEVISLLY